MEQSRPISSIRKVILLKTDEAGAVTPVVLFEAAEKKKKSTRILRPLEKLARHAATAESTFASDYLSRHERSNAKKKDGWIRDIVPNLAKAAKHGAKESPLGRLILD
ncbi:MAG: hypothetical protein WCP29_01355 [Acidobacteriota bacterium]